MAPNDTQKIPFPLNWAKYGGVDMRYTNIDLQCTDIMWFGVDVNGYIAAFTSGGEAFVPEFVCRSVSETEMLEDHFLNHLEKSTDYVLFAEEKDNCLIRNSKTLSGKGVYCFDVSSDKESDYVLISYPRCPLPVDALPQEIRDLLESHRMLNVFEGSDSVNLDRAL